MESALNQAASWLATSGKSIALTGAGVSTESGIPDFRSADGLWARFNPAEYATLGAFRRDPEKVWRMLAELEEVLAAKPNPGHIALAEFEAEGGLAGIITQNVDGLHQAAGSRTVVEFHGSGRTFSCLACGANYPRSQVETMGMPPSCTNEVRGGDCGAILKPDVVFFDEQIPARALAQSAQLVQGAELILVVGTSCEAYPASEIPHQVRMQGGKVVEINLEPADGLAPDAALLGKFSEVMPSLLERWRSLRA
jgi:NAD-dependent deacetylase